MFSFVSCPSMLHPSCFLSICILCYVIDVPLFYSYISIKKNVFSVTEWLNGRHIIFYYVIVFWWVTLSALLVSCYFYLIFLRHTHKQLLREDGTSYTTHNTLSWTMWDNYSLFLETNTHTHKGEEMRF